MELGTSSNVWKNVYANQLSSTVANGTAPLVVTSRTAVTNLNADLLDGQEGSYYLDYTNFTNKPTIPDITGKLDKTTYEWNKEVIFGGSGKLYIGSFPMYDSCVTVTIKAMTNTTYYGVFVLSTQNIDNTGAGSYKATVYGDATNTIAPNILIERPANTNLFNIYFNPPAWSKNLIHIQAVSLNTSSSHGDVAPPTNICTSVTSIPSGATITPTNALTTNFLSITGTAAKATKDASGNVITSTYATKTEVTTCLSDAKNYTDTAVSNLVDSSPDALNTLNELAAALGNDANFATTVNNNIATKMPKAGGQFTGPISFSGSAALPELTSMQYVLGITSFTDGGKVRWSNVTNLKVGKAGTADTAISATNATNAENAVKATKDGSGNVITNTYTAKSNSTSLLYYAEDSGSTTAGTWLATCSDVTNLYDGLSIKYKVTVAGANPTKLNLNGLGAKTVYMRGTSKVTTQYAVGTMIALIYNSDTDAWYTFDYDANNYAYVRQYQSGKNAAGATGKYPLLARYNVTNKNGSYDTAYSRFHTDAYIDITTGNIYAPAFYESGNALSAVYANKTTPITVLGVSASGSSGVDKEIADNKIKFLAPIIVSQGTAEDFVTVDIQDASTSYRGLMSSTDKTNLDSLVSTAVKTSGAQTITGVKTFNDHIIHGVSSAIKWTAKNSKAPYIGYCTGSTDGTFVVASLTGTTYSTGLSIGGSSGNLLWKGTKVATVSDIVTYDVASDTTSGLMSPAYVTKLNSLSAITAYQMSDTSIGTIKNLMFGSNFSVSKYMDQDGDIFVNYTPSTATASRYGTIKVSSVNSSAVTVNAESTTTGRYYPIELNSDGKAIVNVPWSNTTYDAATTSTAGLMSASDKTKLNGLSNYTLPTATSSTLGGVKTGSNITNSSGTISVTSTNVTDALGYTPANTTDLENKADVYKTTVGGGRRNIQVGDDLSGKTIYFDTTKVTSDLTSAYPLTVQTSSSNYFIESSISPPSITVNGTEVFHYSSGWAYSSMTLPNTAGTVTSITGDVGRFIQIEATAEVSVDCEYNYNEIQALKETVNNSSSGLYKHNIKISTGSNYYVYVDVYTSSDASITTASQLFAILGTNYTTGSFDGADGYGAVTFCFNSAGTAIIIKGTVISGTSVNIISLSNQTVGTCTDTVKQV